MQLKGDNLTCSRGGREVFAGLNFSLSGGEALVVTGRNGARTMRTAATSSKSGLRGAPVSHSCIASSYLPTML